jgi:hypothetical protein
MTPTPMETLGTVVTQILTWLGNVLTTITGNALLLIPFAIFVVGACIGLVKRLLG